MSRKGDGKNRTSKATDETFAKPSEPAPYYGRTPKFCLNHLQSGWGVTELSVSQRADFAMALEKRRSMTWQQLYEANHHGLGYEYVYAHQIKPSIPRAFQDNKKFIVFRYSGLLPMVGVRTEDLFQIVWIEKAFNELYDHGS